MVSVLLFSFLMLFLVFLVISVTTRRGAVKNMTNHHNAKYAFYYLLSLAALIFTALAVGMVVFGIIDKSIIDALDYNSYSNVDAQLKFAISALFIAAPTYYFMSRLINQGLNKGELEKDSALRRWLTYFIILVASVIILGVFVSIINNFLSGELTMSFIFKAISMLIIAAIVFSFYFYDIKRPEIKAKDLVVRLFAWGSVALVLAAFISAWFFVESPQLARAKRLDQIVVNNIYQLENAVNSYYAEFDRLPVNLEEIKNSSNIYFDFKSTVDPESQQPIEYKVDGEKNFSFCATFRAASDEERRGNMNNVNNKEHGIGYTCLQGQLWSDVDRATDKPRLID